MEYDERQSISTVFPIKIRLKQPMQMADIHHTSWKTFLRPSLSFPTYQYPYISFSIQLYLLHDKIVRLQ